MHTGGTCLISVKPGVGQKEEDGQRRDVSIVAVVVQGTPTLRELKLQYYELLIRYHAHSNSYLDICRCYKAIFEDEGVAKDASLRKPILRKICW